MPSRACLLLLLSAALCCDNPPSVVALHTVPRPGAAAADFYDLPFPDDVRLHADGTYDLSAYPLGSSPLQPYLNAMNGAIAGAGPSAAVVMRFDGAVDATTLTAGAALVDITPGSPTYGQASPIVASFHESGGAFIGSNWLALRPYPGIPLREHTTYAALLTGALRGKDGGAVLPAPDLTALLGVTMPDAGADAALAAAWTQYAPLRSFLAQSPTAAPVVGAAVFTTQNATQVMRDLRQAVLARPAPVATDLTYYRDDDGLCQIYTGHYLSPNFQQGSPPYLISGGAIQRDPGSGEPVWVRDENLRFAVSVPNGPMPASGWPVALYAHGTGGDYLSFVSDSTDQRAAYIEEGSGASRRLTGRIAVISIDQVLHGPRDPTGSSPDLTFFNLQNITAARDNPLQGALDDFQLLRLVQSLNVAAAPVTGRPIRFDTSRIYFIGHSQGGLTGPLFVSAAPEIRAAVFSGAGAVLVLSLLNKTQPNNIQQLVDSILGEVADADHPFLNLLQAFFEHADPNNYGRLFFREPPSGQAPKSIYQSLGLWDHYAPVPNIMAFGLSMGVQPVGPALLPVPGLELTGQTWAPTVGGVRGNVAGGRATGVLREYPQAAGSDGHFVIFDVWAARNDWSGFLSGDLSGGMAALP